MQLPNLKDIKSFRFTEYYFDKDNSKAVLKYAFDDKIFFEETFVFENAPKVSKERLEAVNRCLKYLHLAAGVSYYKAFVPKNIIVETFELTKNEAEFFNKFYLFGLGEFSVKNDIDLSNVINFPCNPNLQRKEFDENFELKEECVVPVGGGKDSIVTIEALKSQKMPVRLFSVGLPKPIVETIKVSGLDNITVTRKICPNLLELNKNQEETGALNGHIPVTGVFAFVLTLSAFIYDFDVVAMSNESSANSGNLTKENGFSVNHQWSKSIEFETMFQDLCCNYITKKFKYFSFLRPLAELYIAKLFARNTAYFDVFTSCNKAFKIIEKDRIKGWCLNCDKCRFVFLALAPFIEKEKLIDIFGKDLLDDENQREGYLELLGLSKHKPFECVGEILECQAAFYMLSKKEEWQKSRLVSDLRNRIKFTDVEMDNIIKKVFHVSEKHKIPEKYMEALNAYLRT